jgi:hypothetical protein
MPLNFYVKTATNKRLLISKSRGDSNRCTPCSEKPDKHDMYAFHLSPRTVPEKKGSRSVPSFSPEPTLKQWGQSQASVDGRLLGLLGSYHQHTIGTFNTCSRESTHQSLTDTGGGYNLVGAGLPTLLPDFPNQRSYTFHLMAPPDLRLSIQTLQTEIKREQTLNLVSGTSPLDFYHILSS